MHAVIILETIGPKEASSNYFLGKCFFFVKVHPYMTCFDLILAKVLFPCNLFWVFSEGSKKSVGVNVRVAQIHSCTINVTYQPNSVSQQLFMLSYTDQILTHYN